MENTYDYDLWIMVILNVVLFGAFVVGFIRPKKKYEWRSLGVFAAFIVALFAEMYGFPLTIYILTSLLNVSLPVGEPFQHVNGHLLGTLLGLPLWGKLVVCQIGGLGMVAGLILMGKGWKRIHGNSRELVTEGIYGKVRHPQYSGMFLFSSGLLIQWPTLLGLIMWPLLMAAYYRLALREEYTMITRFGEEYREYARQVPRFLPRKKRKIDRTNDNEWDSEQLVHYDTLGIDSRDHIP